MIAAPQDRLITTSAQSSARSPANERQSSTAARGDLGGGQFERRSHDLRQPLEPVELAVAPGLHDAVRVDDDRAARIDPRVALLVRLTGLDAECETAHVELVDGAVR